MIVWRGVATGAIGFATVAAFFLLADPIAGRPVFYTAALLGDALFFGVSDPAAVTVSPAPVIAYNAAHLLVFLAIGALAAGLASAASRHPHLWFLAIHLLLLVTAHAAGVVLALSGSLGEAISVWTVIGATAAAVVTMTAYLLWVNPPLRHEMRGREYEEP
jgi:hypothetical protein